MKHQLIKAKVANVIKEFCKNQMIQVSLHFFENLRCLKYHEIMCFILNTLLLYVLYIHVPVYTCTSITRKLNLYLKTKNKIKNN